MPDARTDDPGPDHAERVLTHPEALVDIALAALREKALNLDAENAVHGLDAHEELWFHPLLADGFAAAGLGVAREALYPGNVEALARLRARRAQRERCDLVLLPRAGARLLDPVARSIERDDIGTTLFAPVAEHLPPEPSGVAPADAYWMEVKVADPGHAPPVHAVRDRGTVEQSGGSGGLSADNGEVARTGCWRGC
ncbi:hypothetical protein J4558_14085 [Leptolyngbya sp. 15MV]|nr:hypothetical protein J4558_14085 [Leptolyngbya sp. 15MV]